MESSLLKYYKVISGHQTSRYKLSDKYQQGYLSYKKKTEHETNLTHEQGRVDMNRHAKRLYQNFMFMVACIADLY